MIDQSVFNNLTALYHTFGCKLNFAETSTIAQTLADAINRKILGLPGNPDDPSLKTKAIGYV